MSESSNSGNHTLAQAVNEDDHSLGPADAPITIVEYGDYECPDCLNAFPIMRQVRQILGDRVRFVFRHFPQSSIHPHASAAAEAAEAAADQGKFWEMHETLFEHHKELDDLSHLALRLGLEIYGFESTRSSGRHRQRVRGDHQSGRLSGVTKTPTFFINGCEYNGAIEVSAIVAAARAASSTK